MCEKQTKNAERGLSKTIKIEGCVRVLGLEGCFKVLEFEFRKITSFVAEN